MKSFIKFILSNRSGTIDETTTKAWLDNPSSMFDNLSNIDKCAFLMHQAVMINYLDRTYDNVLPNLLNLFKEEIVKWWLPEVEDLTKNEDDPNIEYYKSAYLNISALLGTNPINIIAQECINILNQEGKYPCASDVSFYRPYLLFVEKATSISRMTDIDLVSNDTDFSVSETVSIPQFNVVGSLLIANFDLTFSNYSFSSKNAYGYGSSSEGKGITSIFSYWRNYNWSGYKLNSVVGVLAMQCLELDINAIPKHSLMLGFYQVYRMVVPEFKPNTMTQLNNNWLSSDISYIRRCFLFFLMDLRKRFNIELDDSKLIAKFIDPTDEEANKVHEFLNANSASEVSVEAYNAFKKSFFVQFAELDIIKHERVSGRELVNRLIDAKKPTKSDINDIEKAMDAADEGDGDSDTSKQDESKSKKSQSKSKSRPGQSDADDIESTLSDIDNVDDNPQDDTSSPDQNEDPIDDESNTNEQPDDEPNDQQVEQTDGDDGDVSELDNQTDNTHTQQNDDQDEDTEPELPEMSDTKGVKLKLSEGETLDSVLYRDELEAYVDSIITNPPNYLSVQKLEFLKYIKAYWWNLLSIQSLYDHIKAVIRIPKSIKLK